MGVAVIVSTSTLLRRVFRCSLCATPNRCSSSITASPRSANFTSLLSSRCVPITTSTSLRASFLIVSACCLAVWKRLRTSIRTG